MASSRKDMRRDDLVVPFVEPEKDKPDADMSSMEAPPEAQLRLLCENAKVTGIGTMASTLPMAAIFTRNKLIGWTAVVFALQSWLAESPEQKRVSSTPGYFSVGMALMSLAVAYLPLFLPPPPGRVAGGSGTEAPAAVPSP